jgi:uncharacterized protein with ATP-grasp and redox domains
MILASRCLVCAQNVALQSARFVTHDEAPLKEVVFRMMDVLKDARPRNVETFLVGLVTMEVIKEVTGCGDPYKAFKEKSTLAAKRLVPLVADAMKKSDDPLMTACRAAVMGNYLDVVADGIQDMVRESTFTNLRFAVNDFDQLRAALPHAKKIVYITDNAGEVFLDRLFIEGMLAEKKDAEVDYFIKGFPFLSDALYEDIVDAHMEEIATVKTIPLIEPIEMSRGYIDKLFEGFVEVARQADLVVAKGQANFELLPSMDVSGFYLFMHKCPVIAEKEGAQLGEGAICKR